MCRCDARLEWTRWWRYGTNRNGENKHRVRVRKEALRERTPSNRLECLLNGGHAEEKLIRAIRKRHKFMVNVERAGGLVESFHHNTHRGYFGGVSPASVQGIHQE